MSDKGYKKMGNQPVDNSCPTPESVIAQFLQAKTPRLPKMAPADPFQFARWWMAHQAPPDNFTEGAQVLGDGRWNTPYHDRLMYTLKRFLNLKSVHQIFVIEQIERGTAWKGDDIDRFQAYCEEFGKMSKTDKNQYIENAFKQMKKTLRGMVVRND